VTVAKSPAAKGKSDQQRLFQQKVRFVGKTNKLDLYARQQQDGTFKVYALHQKAGVDQRLKGMVSVHKTQKEAIEQFEKLSAQCVEAGWRQTVSWTKSAFDAVPVVE
jgi:hypothetical protein